MTEFNDVWQLLRRHGSSNKLEAECAALWSTYSPLLQDRIYESIRTKLEQQKFVHYNPLQALKENAVAQKKRQLSFSAYYARYHTTEPLDGWRMVNPTGQKVMYVK